MREMFKVQVQAVDIYLYVSSGIYENWYFHIQKEPGAASCISIISINMTLPQSELSNGYMGLLSGDSCVKSA